MTRGKRGAGGGAFFQEVLDDRFSLIRADGTTADKEQFLAGLANPENVSEVLTTQIRQVRVMDGQALVEALVRLRGTRGGEPAAGRFRNLRLFEQSAEGWRCACGSTSGSMTSALALRRMRVRARLRRTM